MRLSSFFVSEGKPPEPVVDAAPAEQETVEQLHSLSHKEKVLSRPGMLKGLGRFTHEHKTSLTVTVTML